MDCWAMYILERASEAAHDEWMAEKLRRGCKSWPNEEGIEQLVPYKDLSEPIKDFDRIVVTAIIERLKSIGLTY